MSENVAENIADPFALIQSKLNLCLKLVIACSGSMPMLACMLTPLDLAFEDTCLGVLKGYKPMKK